MRSADWKIPEIVYPTVKKLYKGTLEELINDLDDILESYALFLKASDEKHSHFYEYEDIDTVEQKYLERKVLWFKQVKEFDSFIIDVYLD